MIIWISKRVRLKCHDKKNIITARYIFFFLILSETRARGRWYIDFTTMCFFFFVRVRSQKFYQNECSDHYRHGLANRNDYNIVVTLDRSFFDILKNYVDYRQFSKLCNVNSYRNSKCPVKHVTLRSCVLRKKCFLLILRCLQRNYYRFWGIFNSRKWISFCDIPPRRKTLQRIIAIASSNAIYQKCTTTTKYTLWNLHIE